MEQNNNNENGENRERSESKKTVQNFFSACLSWCKANIITLKGVAALLLGTFLILTVRAAFLHVLFFCAGLFFVYQGFAMLGITQVTDTINKLLNKTICKNKF